MHAEPGPADAAPAAPPRRAWPRWLLAAVLLLALTAFYLLGLSHYLSWDYVRSNLDWLKAQVDDNLPLALFIFFAVYVAATALSIPSAAGLTLLGGALFGRWLATLITSVASTIGATVAFLSSRYLFHDWVRRQFGPRLEPVYRGVARDGAYYLFTMRLVPAIPFFLINLGMGLTPIRPRTYLWVSWLGMLPITFIYANTGTALANIESPRDALSPTVLASLALFGVVSLALRLAFRAINRGRRPG